jgi:hypothetical protein
MRNEPRPQSLIDIDAHNNEDEEQQPIVADTGPQCSYCGTYKTSMWRRNKDGEQVCNACGVYYRVNGRERPLTMKQRKVKPIRAKVSDDVEMTDSEITVNFGECKRVSDSVCANPYLPKATPTGSTLGAPASYSRPPQHTRSMLTQRGGSPSGSDLWNAGTQLSTILDTTQLRCLTRNDCK